MCRLGISEFNGNCCAFGLDFFILLSRTAGGANDKVDTHVREMANHVALTRPPRPTYRMTNPSCILEHFLICTEVVLLYPDINCIYKILVL